jgi:hypothetical protein
MARSLEGAAHPVVLFTARRLECVGSVLDAEDSYVYTPDSGWSHSTMYVPGVLSVAGASNVPFQAPTWAPRILLPSDEPEGVRQGIAGYAITPSYLETMGIDLVTGRGIGPEDGPDAEKVVLVNEAFVRTQLDSGDALGTSITRDAEFGDVGRAPIPTRSSGWWRTSPP